MTEKTSKRRVYAMFAIVVVACAIGSLTQTVMNAMLGIITVEFGVDDYTGQWLTTAFMLGIGITVPLVAHLSRKLSVRALTMVALALFLAGSVCDLFATNFWVLLAGRIPQAVATGITLPLLQTIAMVRFPEGRRGTAMGIAGIAMGFAPNIGPLVGGALVGSLGWRSFFVILTAALAVLIVCTLAFMRREDAPARDARLDVLSFLQSTLGFGCLLIAFTNAAASPVTDAGVWMNALAGAMFLAAFVLRQRYIENPLISMGIFRSRVYTVSFIAQNCLFASFMGITLVIPLFVQNVCGMTALEAGLVFIPATVLAVAVNPLAGIACDRIGARPVIIGGALLLTAGAVSMAFVDETCPLGLLTLMQTVRGIGVSSLIGPLNSWGMRELPRDLTVDGSAFFTTVRQACASLGTALMMLVISAFAADAVAGFDAAFALSAALSAAVLALAVWKVR